MRRDTRFVPPGVGNSRACSPFPCGTSGHAWSKRWLSLPLTLVLALPLATGCGGAPGEAPGGGSAQTGGGGAVDAGGVKQYTAAQLPKGTVEGLNDWKRTGYGGPCPPIGRHRYFHKLYALDTVLPGLRQPTKAQVEKAMQGHVLAQAQLVGTYQKGQR